MWPPEMHAGGAADEREDHAAEGPGDALPWTPAVAHLLLGDLLTRPPPRQHAGVEEEEGGHHELGDAGAVEGTTT
jgi:hypothetical protein